MQWSNACVCVCVVRILELFYLDAWLTATQLPLTGL